MRRSSEYNILYFNVLMYVFPKKKFRPRGSSVLVLAFVPQSFLNTEPLGNINVNKRARIFQYEIKDKNSALNLIFSLLWLYFCVTKRGFTSIIVNLNLRAKKNI